MKKISSNIYKLIAAILMIVISEQAAAQVCTPQGDQVTYGTNNVWLGYVYRGTGFNVYKGYTTQGLAASPDFDQSFGGNQVQYATNGCPVLTDTFSVRYKLTQSFTPGSYQITVGGDDGYRFSVDGGTTWVINEWSEHSYKTTTISVNLNGLHNLVLEYYERFIDNRVSFKIEAPCAANEDQSVYGAGFWKAYLYTGMNFSNYKGSVTAGTVANPNFDMNFGGDNTTFNTSGCPITTNVFSVRYRMTKTLPAGNYIITVGGDDGYRLSMDGGSSFVISKWVDQGYGTTTYSAYLNGTFNMMLEYYENGGGNRITFSMASATLPVKLISFTGADFNNGYRLAWKCTDASDFSHFIVQKSADGRNFEDFNTVQAESNYAAVQSFSSIDNHPLSATTYYRLAMVDIDGTTAYSSIITKGAKAGETTRIYPTVIENKNLVVENFSNAKQAKIEIFDMNGHLVFTKALSSGKQQVALQISKPSASYVARITASNELVLSQLIVVR